MSKNSMPENAKRVYKGKIFEVWQWEQKMFDGSTETFEKLRRPDTAVVIPTVGKKILVQIEKQPHRQGSFYSLPGGRCDWSEDPLHAAKRELLEETGYESNDWALWREVDPVEKIDWTVYTYIAKNCAQSAGQKLDAGEKIELKMISFDEFLMLSEDPTFREPRLVGELFRARYDAKAKEEFKKLLFG